MYTTEEADWTRLHVNNVRAAKDAVFTSYMGHEYACKNIMLRDDWTFSQPVNKRWPVNWSRK